MPTLEFNGKSSVYARQLSVPFRELAVDAAKPLSAKDQRRPPNDNLNIDGDNLHAPKAPPLVYAARKRLVLCALFLASVFLPYLSNAVGVTVITHGYDGDVTGWITAMADAMPTYFHYLYPGLSTNFTIYTIVLTKTGTNYYYRVETDNTNSPSSTDTGEIVVKLDWSQMAGSPDPLSSAIDVSTYDVAAVASWVLLQTNTITNLNGHALVEYPMHLIGHSRGGSLMSQISYILGTNGIWVDHLTTLDPHPLNNDGNDDSPISVVDASASNTYANVLFADNYYQHLAVDIDLDPRGEPAAGAYRRQLSSLSGGYINDPLDIFNDPYEYHSNVHLWYYGTIDLDVPTLYVDDGYEIIISATMRKNWWTQYEDEGLYGGFYYSLLGGGNRLSTDMPLGLPGDPAIVDGYNQYWDLGAGIKPNRTALPSNHGTWPNIIKFNVAGTNVVAQGNPLVTKLYYQYAGQSNITLRVFFDRDLNPYNTNSVLAIPISVPSTGAGAVYPGLNISLNTDNLSPGYYAIYGQISDGVHTRYLYTPEIVEVVASQRPPVLSIAELNGSQFMIVVKGASSQTIVLQASTDLQNWLPLATNVLTADFWNYTNNPAANVGKEFYRASLLQ